MKEIEKEYQELENKHQNKNIKTHLHKA